MSEYIEWRSRQNVKRFQLSNKEKFYRDLKNIEYSWTGRMDTNIANIWIMEAVQQIVNAMVLFELGYLDCAYYSLRTAMELSEEMAFLCDLHENDRKKYYNAWRKRQRFPFKKDMINKLIAADNNFGDMYKAMPEFFHQAEVLNGQLNKFVHKQGFIYFYVFRNQSVFDFKSDEILVKDFEQKLKGCISFVAVMRLGIDPFPILLTEEDLLFRQFYSLTEPYDKDFVDEYIGEINISRYKKTKNYLDTREQIEQWPKITRTVFDIVRYHYIDTTKKEEIMSQLQLLSKDDSASTIIALASNKVTKIYPGAIGWFYSTDKTPRDDLTTFIDSQLLVLASKQEYINKAGAKTFASAFWFEDGYYVVEHARPFTGKEVSRIKQEVEQMLLAGK